MSTNAASLYERVGGEVALALLVDRFYSRVLKDPELEPHFRNVPMEKLQAMQVELFASALGGPNRYSGRPLAEVHRGMGISRPLIGRFLRHLLATIEFLHPNAEEVRQIYERIGIHSQAIAED
jgi:hemoglobin